MRCSDITSNLEKVKERITSAEKLYNRTPGSVALLAVSKTRSIDELQCALESGQRDFGESYLQDALPKIAVLKNPQPIWHFIGPIQSNKTKAIAENFSWVHSVNSLKIAERLSKQRPPELPALNVCLQSSVPVEAAFNTPDSVTATDPVTLNDFRI